MKKMTLLLVSCLLCMFFTAKAQVDTIAITDSTVLVTPSPAPEDTAWKIGGNFGLQFSQSAYSNWQAGGINALAGNGLFNIFANYDDGGRWTWYNRLTLAYGLAKQDTLLSKTDDRIELESRVDRKIGERWNMSALLNFRTQFSPGYQTPGERYDSTVISRFMAPAYTLFGVGFTYKPNDRFSAFLSPATGKLTIVNDPALSAVGAYGVDTGATTRVEIGGYVNLRYKAPIVKNVDLQASLDLYSNYLDNQYKFIDVNGELILFMKINDYMTANLSVNVIYDHDILIADEDGNILGPRTQVKEVLGVGFAYNFGDKIGK